MKPKILNNALVSEEEARKIIEKDVSSKLEEWNLGGTIENEIRNKKILINKTYYR